MRSLSTLIAGLLLASTLTLAPDTSFARGGGGGGHSGGGGHFGGGHFTGGHSGGGHFGGGHFGHGGHFGGFHNRGFGFDHHSHHRFYGFYGPFDYGLDGLDDYAEPYDDDNDAFEVSGTTSDDSTSLTLAAQKELTQLGYYRGPIDGIAGSQTAQAVRWFQSVNHLPVTGQIDSETIEVMRIG